MRAKMKTKTGGITWINNKQLFS